MANAGMVRDETLEPEVSLVVIAYNERAHIADCVDAIFEQRTDATFELILVDDGSTDETAELAALAAGGSERFRLVRQPMNSGRGAAREAGVEAARGAFIGFVDADVVLPRDWLARCLAALPGNAAVGGIAVPDGHTAVLARMSGATPRDVGGSMPVTGSNVLFDGTILRRIGFDPEDRLGEDFRLSARLRKAGYSLVRVPGLVAKHEESKSYPRELRWRFANGVDAASHPREFGLRFADVVWLGWLGGWTAGIAAAVTISPSWLMLGPVVSIGAGGLHAASRFKVRPIGSFLIACLANVPLLTAYFVGRTLGLPRLLRGRR